MLEINRSNIYYKPRLMLDFTNSIANEIKGIWSKYSFFGYRKITAVLNNKNAQKIIIAKIDKINLKFFLIFSLLFSAIIVY